MSVVTADPAHPSGCLTSPTDEKLQPETDTKREYDTALGTGTDDSLDDSSIKVTICECNNDSLDDSPIQHERAHQSLDDSSIPHAEREERARIHVDAPIRAELFSHIASQHVGEDFCEKSSDASMDSVDGCEMRSLADSQEADNEEMSSIEDSDDFSFDIASKVRSGNGCNLSSDEYDDEGQAVIENGVDATGTEIRACEAEEIEAVEGGLGLGLEMRVDIEVPIEAQGEGDSLQSEVWVSQTDEESIEASSAEGIEFKRKLHNLVDFDGDQNPPTEYVNQNPPTEEQDPDSEAQDGILEVEIAAGNLNATVGQDLNGGGQDLNAEPQDRNFGAENIKAEAQDLHVARDLNAEVQDLPVVDQDLNGGGQDLNAEPEDRNFGAENIKAEAQDLHAEVQYLPVVNQDLNARGQDLNTEAQDENDLSPLPRFFSMATIHNLDSVLSQMDQANSDAFSDADVPAYNLSTRTVEMDDEIDHEDSMMAFGRTESTVFWTSDTPVEELLENHRKKKSIFDPDGQPYLDLDALCEESAEAIKSLELEMRENSDDEGKVIVACTRPEEDDAPIFRSGWGRVQLMGPCSKACTGWGEWQGLPRSSETIGRQRSHSHAWCTAACSSDARLEDLPSANEAASSRDQVNMEVTKDVNVEKLVSDKTVSTVCSDPGRQADTASRDDISFEAHSVTGMYVREHVRRALGKLRCLPIPRRTIPT